MGLINERQYGKTRLNRNDSKGEYNMSIFTFVRHHDTKYLTHTYMKPSHNQTDKGLVLRMHL